MLGAQYKKILDYMPAGVFVFNDKKRVLFTNAAFRRSFPQMAKSKGAIKDVIACPSKSACGSTDACSVCNFHQVMDRAIKTGKEQTASATVTLPRGDRTDTLVVRIRVYPVGEKNKLFLGLTDGSFQSDMAREMLSAKRMQQRLLPVGKSVAGVPYSFIYLPCLEVGGDMPDVYEHEGQAYGIISDVSGKGVSAGMLSTFVKAGFDHKLTSLADALNVLSDKFSALNLDERSYITLAGVRIDPQEQLIRYTSAGHNAPILLKNSFGINEIEFPAPPISNWIEGCRYEERSFPYEHGDVLVLLTDGVTECANSAGELFTIERAESVLMQSHSAEDFIAKLKGALTVFSGGKFTDDITVVAFDL